jgi:hypothetical protein
MEKLEDVHYRSKRRYITQLIHDLRKKVKAADSTIIKMEETVKLEEILLELESKRDSMEADFKRSQLKRLSLQAKDVVSNVDNFMSMVAKSKTIFTKFEDLKTIANPKKIIKKKLFDT